MKNFLIIVDMQNDFIDGALGTDEAVSIVPKVKKMIDDFSGEVIFTRDTHTEEYLNTREGKYLPIVHCVKGTDGWQMSKELTVGDAIVFDKHTFGSRELAEFLISRNKEERIASVTLAGLCTDICVISNAMLIKAALPETDVIVDSSCSAGVTPESHERALSAMAACQIIIK